MTGTIIKNSTLFTCTFSVASASRPTSTGCQCEQQDFLSLCLVLNTHTKIQTDYCAVCFSFCSKCYVSSITLPVLQSVLSRPLFISPHPHFKFLRRLKTLAPSLPAFPKSFKLHTLPLQHLWAPSVCLSITFSEGCRVSLRDPAVPSFLTGLLSPAVRLALLWCPSLPAASRVCL